MDILKTATDWAKAEVFSSSFFILFGAAFLVASFGFWHMGKTDMAKAYMIPTLVAGVLLLILGGGLIYGSPKSLAGLEAAYTSDAKAFVASEIARVEGIMAQYKIAVFRVMPLIVIISAALIIVFQSPIWRASLITTIVFLGAIMLVDSNANARLETYKAKLLSAKSAE